MQRFIEIMDGKCKIILFGEPAEGINESDDNLDVEIHFNNIRYFGTFFTISSIESLFRKNVVTGENKSGLYLYATDMIIVKNLTVETIVSTVSDLIETNDLDFAFSSVPADDV